MGRYSSIGDRELIDETATLSAGQVVLVEHGPIVIAGQPWFLVSNVDEDYPNERWDDRGHGVLNSEGSPWVSSGWVLGADGTSAFLTPTGEPTGTEETDYALMHGVGDAESGEFEFGGTAAFTGPYPAALEWVAGAVDGQACDVRITMQPEGHVLLDDRISHVGGGFTLWPQEGPVPAGEHRFSIESDCSWSLHAYPAVG